MWSLAAAPKQPRKMKWWVKFKKQGQRGFHLIQTIGPNKDRQYALFLSPCRNEASLSLAYAYPELLSKFKFPEKHYITLTHWKKQQTHILMSINKMKEIVIMEHLACGFNLKPHFELCVYSMCYSNRDTMVTSVQRNFAHLLIWQHHIAVAVTQHSQIVISK